MTTITLLPDPPTRASPVDFSSKADTFLAALPTFGTECNAVAGEVNTNASTASAAASTATTQAGIATTKANEAAVSAATAINAPGTTATSTTSSTIGTGSKTFTIQTGKAFVVGQWVTIADTSAPSTNYMVGIITAHNSGTGSITADVSITLGTGTLSSWSIAMTSAGGVTLTGAQTLSTKTLTSPRYTRDDDGSIAGGTWAIDYNNGPLIKATVGAAITTITLSNLPSSGTIGHLKLMLVNPGAFAITFPAAWKFIKSDFTTTNFAGLGVTLPASGVSFFDLITDDNGSNVYVTISRN